MSIAAHPNGELTHVWRERSVHATARLIVFAARRSNI